jgi:hypothetical protein
MSLLVACLVLAISGGVIGIAGAAPVIPQGRTTVPVRPNAPAVPIDLGHFLDPFTVGANVRVANRSGAQSETAIAVDPTNSLHLVAAANDLSNFSNYDFVWESNDGGVNWDSAGFTAGAFCYDPWLDFDANGRVYFAYECYDQRIAYQDSYNGTWTKKLLTNAGGFPDRDMVVVDTTGGTYNNRAYIGYDDANAGNAAYVLYGSGSTFTKSAKINDSSNTIGVNAAVGSNGDVYATWLDYPGSKIKSDKSINGGATWGADHTVTNLRQSTSSFWYYGCPAQPDRGLVLMSFSDADNSGGLYDGRYYIVYMDKPPTGTITNIYIRYSDDGGTSWSAEVQVNDSSSVCAFHPTVSVSDDGTVGVTYYDTRMTTGNKKANRWASFSTNGGVSWSASQRVSSKSSDESGFGDANDYGDYQNADFEPNNNTLHPVWTDSRPAANAEDEVTGTVTP